jgi:1-acyl-sn-glycerol-3-phosphate acyltransferase
MIIEAKHHTLVYPFFKLYALYKIRRNFKEVIITGFYEEKNLPVLLVSNHLSWWDGFWAMYLNLKLLHRKFHFMMLEDQLRRYSFFINTGGYSVRKGSRSVIESINYTKKLLADNKNMVLLFPQGKITSVYDQSLKFEKGLEHILKDVDGKVQIVFMANLVDYFSNEKPTLYMYIREFSFTRPGNSKPEEEYNMFYRECVAENIKRSDL